MTVSQSCSLLHPSFRSGVQIHRKCGNDGNWSPVDLRDCTMFIGSDPVVVVYFTIVVITNSTDDMVFVAQEILNDVSLIQWSFLSSFIFQNSRYLIRSAIMLL